MSQRPQSNPPADRTTTDMTEPIAYLNGQYVPISQAALSVFDLGVVAGAAVTEMVRTFQHVPFRLTDHLNRLEHGLSALGITSPISRPDLEAICQRVVSENCRLIPSDHELGLIVFVTTGQNLTYLGRNGLARTPSLCVHTFPLPFELWADQYTSGIHLIASTVRGIPEDVISPEIKHRNRLHWQLADKQVKQTDPTAMAVLLDHEGFLTETATGNICVVEGSTILTPEHGILHGISRRVVAELATSIGLTLAYTRMGPEELSQSKEAFLTSTPHCLLPITKFNGQPVGTGQPGPVYERIITAWGDLVHVNIRAQMRDGAISRTSEP